MLDTDTKRRIDTARDILVGKVPDPKSQVEQITIALIYKFMDDMDAESEELGGKRKFFADEFADYGWAKLMHTGLSGYKTLELYAEAMTRMPENTGIPLLFRNIFKNAYLPYNDPETLKMFLKVIDEFKYDHSERLGDAFEYLLSVLGSQGDAGQFRTPRHIIDFMVKIIDPKKNESVLDPACGTAGFLISSYKHILKANSDAKGNTTLTHDDKDRLAQNFKGYDISPDMVRLSLVNLYLHGFADPHITEYDTLASQDNWNEYADVILANPPFMSPKGGIKPHNRFSVQSKRSEVLFVDYMAEHLKPTGRAGIIVPEGIIFQSQTAYKQLRDLLVKQYLVAVVSMPAGLFNPYSGVKTSILILDKSLAKRAGTIAFFKIENDGFSLGAQRREIDKNDLPQAQAEIGEYLRRLRTEGSAGDFQPTLGLIVPKEKISANGEYNLSVERYRESSDRLSHFPILPLGQVAEVIAGQSPPGESYNDTGNGTPFYQGKTEFGKVAIGKPTKWTTDPQRFAEEGDILMSVRAPVGPVNLATQRICIGRGLAAIRPAKGRLLPVYAFYILRSLEKEIIGDTGAAFASINRGDIEKIKIPLPPLEVQKEIVAEIEGYQKIIDGARAVLDNYRPHITINPKWPMVELGDMLTFQRGYDLPKQQWEDGPYPIVGSNGIIGFHAYYKEVGPGVVTGRSGTIGKVHFIDFDYYWPHNTALFVKDFKGNEPKYLKVLLESIDLKSLGEQTAAVPSLDRKNAHRVKVHLPPVSEQQTIIAEIETEQALVTANRELIERFEKKIRITLTRVWGEDETAKV
ncbi:N-6 DNA methylase [Chloroflexota bacterium]